MAFRIGQCRAILVSITVLALTLACAMPSAKGQSTNTERNNVLFAQQDTVTSFNPATGTGRQVGTVTGKVSGTSIVDFQFTLASATTYKIDNKVVITDLDGDQLRIRDQGTGNFIIPIDSTVFGFGGPMVGTYEVLAGTGKFQGWIGKLFRYRAVMSNPIDALGTVYLEVLSNPVK